MACLSEEGEDGFLCANCGTSCSECEMPIRWPPGVSQHRSQCIQCPRTYCPQDADHHFAVCTVPIPASAFLHEANWTRDQSRIFFRGVEFFHVRQSTLAIGKGPSQGLFTSRPFRAHRVLGNYITGSRAIGSNTHPHPEDRPLDLGTASGVQDWTRWITGAQGHWTLEIFGHLFDGRRAVHGLQYINSNAGHNNVRLLRNGSLRTLTALPTNTELFMAYGPVYTVYEADRVQGVQAA